MLTSFEFTMWLLFVRPRTVRIISSLPLGSAKDNGFILRLFKDSKLLLPELKRGLKGLGTPTIS